MAPTTTTAAPKPPPVTTVPAAPVTTVEAAEPEVAKPAQAYYKNCTEAKAAGAAPLHQGDPGYRAALDKDHDGVACEK
ncbi:excalibur calcium-binding domain-containing protein [Actinokineospora inagensis]|uniref:excalibur calcium-binding domain-containing protein n=1 Tax=Actinokineospora inagensis TaxID=103730 RepID=UPI001FDF661B|nr:excalibur calcium-binding domain-containing protein [Actinokineospora inagensis]